MNNELIKQYVLDNPKLVTMRESESHPGLYVLKYRKRVFYDSLWDEYLEECRGTIVDKDFNVISRPFSKIYNFRVEDNSPVLTDDTLVTAYRKVNGFMCSITWANNDILVSTTGSTDSDYVEMAKEMMRKHMCWEDWQMEVCAAKGTTLMFECCHVNDPHIVVEKPGMYFLGYRENAWESRMNGFGVDVANNWTEYATDVLKCYAPESYVIPLGELVEKAKTVQHEGFIFYTKSGVSSKIKSPYYLVSKALARKKDILSLNKKLVEEEYYGMVDHLNTIRDEFNAKSEQERLEYIRNYLEKV